MKKFDTTNLFGENDLNKYIESRQKEIKNKEDFMFFVDEILRTCSSGYGETGIGLARIMDAAGHFFLHMKQG